MSDSISDSLSDSTWSDPRITSYVMDELSAEERAEFEVELETNAELATAVDEARGIKEQLSELYESEDTEGLDPERRESIIGVGSSVHVVRRQETGGFRPPTVLVPMVLMAMAAMLLLMVGVAPWLRQSTTATAIEDTGIVKRAIPPVADVADAADLDSDTESEQAAKTEIMGIEESVVTEATPASESRTQSPESLTANPSSSMRRSRTIGRSKKTKSNSPALEVDAANVKRSASDRGVDSQNLMRIERSSPRDDVAASPIPSAGALPVKPMPRSQIADIEAVKRDLAESEKRGSIKLPEIMRQGVESSGLELQTPSTSNSKKAHDSGLMDKMNSKLENQFGLPAIESGKSRNLDKMIADARRKQAGGSESIDKLNKLPALSAKPKKVSSGVELLKEMNSESDSLRDTEKRKASSAAVDSKTSVEKVSSIRIVGESNAPIQAGGGGFRGFGGTNDQGDGPGKSGDRFETITENSFRRVSEEPLSTFSIDVDTASYSKVRDFLVRSDSMPRVDAVRIEELVNYFDYGYEPPKPNAKAPFAARMIVTGCPWNQEHRLARIAIKGKTMTRTERPPCNLVFLLDTSSSMDAHNKLPLVIDGMKMLADQLNEKDRVAIVAYAGAAGLVLDSVPASQDQRIRDALAQLSAGGSTNGGQGIALAYRVARDHFISDGVNRVVLCTDGDFNVGTTGTDELVRMVEAESKGGIFLSVLGFGMGNHNDAMLEKISGRGNGNYGFIDTIAEAKKVLVDQTSATLVTIAKDVKLQLEFNPKRVSQYRLIGYENRVLAKEDFNDDRKDAGEIGAGHCVTAFYEIVPAGTQVDGSSPKVDDLKYQRPGGLSDDADSNELLTLKLRYKLPDEFISSKVEFPVTDGDGDFDQAEDDFRFAAAVAGFGMNLRRSRYAGSWTLSNVLEVAESSIGGDPHGLRAEFVEMVRKAKKIRGSE